MWPVVGFEDDFVDFNDFDEFDGFDELELDTERDLFATEEGIDGIDVESPNVDVTGAELVGIDVESPNVDVNDAELVGFDDLELDTERDLFATEEGIDGIQELETERELDIDDDDSDDDDSDDDG